MNFLIKVAEFADQYANVSPEEEAGFLKVASDMEVGFADMAALHNVTSANVFTGEGIVKIAEDAEPSRIALVGDLWEGLVNEQLGTETIKIASDQIGLDPEEISFLLDHLDKQAEEAGILGGEDEVMADDETWEKIAEAHKYLSDANIEIMPALDFASDMIAAEDDEAGEKVAAEYSDLDDDTFDKIAEAIEYLSGVEGAYELMDAYDKEAGSILGAVGTGVSAINDGLHKNITIKGIKDGVKKAKDGYVNMVKGKHKDHAKKAIRRTAKDIEFHKAKKDKLIKDEAGFQTGKYDRPSESKSGFFSGSNPDYHKTTEDGMQNSIKAARKAEAKSMVANKSAKKHLRKIRLKQTAAIGGTAAVGTAGAAGVYNAVTN